MSNIQTLEHRVKRRHCIGHHFGKRQVVVHTVHNWTPEICCPIVQTTVIGYWDMFGSWILILFIQVSFVVQLQLQLSLDIVYLLSYFPSTITLHRVFDVPLYLKLSLGTRYLFSYCPYNYHWALWICCSIVLTAMIGTG